MYNGASLKFLVPLRHQFIIIEYSTCNIVHYFYYLVKLVCYVTCKLIVCSLFRLTKIHSSSAGAFTRTCVPSMAPTTPGRTPSVPKPWTVLWSSCLQMMNTMNRMVYISHDVYYYDIISNSFRF